MKKSTKLLLTTTLILLTSAIILFSVDSLKVVAQENSAEQLDQIEEERENNFLDQLLLEVPTITDNPSHTITFADPSEQKQGVELDIDETGFEEIKSPYALPALGIGKHALKFRFVDKYGSTQTLDRDIIVIPRPPIINSPVFQEEFLEITGTGLSNSEIVLILSSDRAIQTEEATIDGDGHWQIQISNENLTEGVYTFTAFTRRYGYASNLAEPVTFKIGQSNNLSVENSKDIYFNFKDISFDNFGKTLSDNIDLGLLIGGSFILGFLISLLIFTFVRNSLENKTVKTFEKKMDGNGDNKNKEMTLKERLSGQDSEAKNRKDTPKKEVKEEKKEEDKTEKILTKIDFLKDYKQFDPDNEDGKENIKVKVTSKS